MFHTNHFHTLSYTISLTVSISVTIIYFSVWFRSIIFITSQIQTNQDTEEKLIKSCSEERRCANNTPTVNLDFVTPYKVSWIYTNIQIQLEITT